MMEEENQIFQNLDQNENQEQNEEIIKILTIEGEEIKIIVYEKHLKIVF